MAPPGSIAAAALGASGISPWPHTKTIPVLPLKPTTISGTKGMIRTPRSIPPLLVLLALVACRNALTPESGDRDPLHAAAGVWELQTALTNYRHLTTGCPYSYCWADKPPGESSFSGLLTISDEIAEPSRTVTPPSGWVASGPAREFTEVMAVIDQRWCHDMNGVALTPCGTLASTVYLHPPPADAYIWAGTDTLVSVVLATYLSGASFPDHHALLVGHVHGDSMAGTFRWSGGPGYRVSYSGTFVARRMPDS